MEKIIYSKKESKSDELLGIYNKLARLYAEVFADPPWNEFTKSSGCDAFFGQETQIGENCPQCGDLLEEAYPEDQTIQHIEKELYRPNSVLTILEDGTQIVGFAWGFSYENFNAFIEEKYKTEEMKIQLLGLFRKESVFDSFFYFSECGIKSAFRGRGLSNQLAEEMIKASEQLMLPLIMRTNFQSPMVSVATRFGMRQIMGPLEDNVINFEDVENSARVLFLKNYE